MNSVWVAANGINRQNINRLETRRKFMVFKSKFFMACFFHFIFNLHMEPYNGIATALLGLALLPQIATNAKFQNPHFDARFVFEYIFPRLAMFFFYRLFPFTLKNLRPLPRHVAISTGVFLACSWVLRIQATRGAIWFVPRFMRRKQFDYLLRKPGPKAEPVSESESPKGLWRRLIDKLKFIFSRDHEHKQFSKSSLKTVNLGQTPEYGELQSTSSITPETDQSSPGDVEAQEEAPSAVMDPCAICLGEMDAEELIEKNEEEYSSQVFKSYSSKYRGEFLMKTPCEHVFHVGK